MKFKVILWDIDGTLLDFHAAESIAIRALFAKHVLGICTDEMIAETEMNLLESVLNGESKESSKLLVFLFSKLNTQYLLTNSFNPFAAPMGSAQNPMDEELNIDDMIKKIDARIAELEEEEKKDKLAKENEEKASGKPKVDIATTALADNQKAKEASKIDFPTFNSQMLNISKNNEPDLMDDFMEDLSNDESYEKDEIKEDKTSVLPVEEKIVENKNTIYKNESEIEKIMNKPENDDDILDDLFE